MGELPELGAGPRRDFSCNSKKCRTEDGAPVYELPVKATRCPVCGSKRITPLFNSINVSKSGFYAVNRIVDREGARQLEIEHTRRDAAIGQQKRGTSTFAVPIGNNGAIGPGIAKQMPQIAPAFQGLTITPGASANEGMRVQKREIQNRPVEGIITARDTTKLARRPDGLVEVRD